MIEAILRYGDWGRARSKRWLLLAAMGLVVAIGSPATQYTFFQSIADAYVQVTVFVGMTLALFYLLEARYKLDTAKLLREHKAYQIPLAAILGALPGCGGAIVVMTQYAAGRLGFGSMIAVLTATMGDAAFLLLAKEPTTALLVFALSLVAGISAGFVFERIHGYDFLRSQKSQAVAESAPPFDFGALRPVWLLLFAPGLVIGVAEAFQVDLEAVLGFNAVLYVGSTGALLSLLCWLVNPYSGPSTANRLDNLHDACRGGRDGAVWNKTIMDTSFVTVWVLVAYLLFELTALWFSLDLKNLFAGAQVWLPMMGVLVGFIPGCGPQVLVTMLYLQGVVPLSAQLGNAISNDGDALFPALMMDAKVAIAATLYSAIPAIIVAYVCFFWFE